MNKHAVWDLEVTLAVEKLFYCFLGQHCPEQITLVGMIHQLYN